MPRFLAVAIVLVLSGCASKIAIQISVRNDTDQLRIISFHTSAEGGDVRHAHPGETVTTNVAVKRWGGVGVYCDNRPFQRILTDGSTPDHLRVEYVIDASFDLQLNLTRPAGGDIGVTSSDAWSRCKVGAVFTQHSVMVTRAPLVAGRSEANYVTQVCGLDALRVELLQSVEMPGLRPERDAHTALRTEATVRPEQDANATAATVTVPAGTFECRYLKSTRTDPDGTEWTTEVWYAPDFPVPYRLVMSGPRSITVELVSFKLE